MEKAKKDPTPPKRPLRPRRLPFSSRDERDEFDVATYMSPSKHFPKTPRSQKKFEMHFEMQRTLTPRHRDVYLRYLDFQEEAKEQRDTDLGEDDEKSDISADDSDFDPDWVEDDPVTHMAGDSDVPGEFSGFESDEQTPVKAQPPKKKLKKENIVEKGASICEVREKKSRVLGEDAGGSDVEARQSGGSDGGRDSEERQVGEGDGGSEIGSRDREGDAGPSARERKDTRGKVKGRKGVVSEVSRVLGGMGGSPSVVRRRSRGRRPSGGRGQRRGSRGRGSVSRDESEEEEEGEEFSSSEWSVSDFDGDSENEGRRRGRQRGQGSSRRWRSLPDEEEGWSQDQTPPPPLPFTATPGLNVPTPATTLGFVQLFLSLEVLEFLTNETNDYATYTRNELLKTRSYHWSPISVPDMARYLGLVIFMGLVTMPRMTMYWEREFWGHAPKLASILPRNRFQSISRYFHTFNRRAIPKGNKDKLITVRPLLEYFQRKCRTMCVPEKHLSLDEGTLPFKGHLSIKVYNPAKPHKYGLKFYFLCDSRSGYVVDFSMYSGSGSSLRDTVFSLVGRFAGQGYHIFMDNYYNSVQLAQEMYDNGLHLSGTLRMNRGAPAVLKHITTYKQMEVGETIFRKKGEVFVLLWRSPTRIVSMITNADAPETVPYLYRKKGGRNRPYVEINMRRPTVIDEYTSYMGGVDHFDQMVNYYSFARRTVRWSKKVIMYLLQLALQNSFALYTKYTTDRKKMNLMRYMNHVAMALSAFDESQWPSTGPPIERAASLPPDQRLDLLPPTPQGHGRTPPSAHAARPTASAPASEPEEDVDDPRPMSPPPAAPPAVPPAVPRNDPIRPLESRIYSDPDIRLQQGEHKMEFLPGSKQRRCRVCHVSGIRKDSRYYCTLCRIPLCNKGTCYTDYHTKERFWKTPARASSEGVRARRYRH